MKTLEMKNVAVIVERLKQTDLQPSPEVNQLYGELVDLALNVGVGTRELLKLTPEQLREVHDICAAGESYLEVHWAKKVASSNAAVSELLTFPYLDNYLKLSGHELALFVKHLEKTSSRKLAYIGSGPLPLTAICYERQGMFDEVVGIDNDSTALEMSQRVCDKLNSGVTFMRADAQEVDYADFAVICVAALVGMDSEEKRRVLASIRQSARPGALVAVRSVYGSRELLYPKLTSLPVGYVEVDSYIPTDDVVNSMHLLRIEGGQNG